MENRPPHQIKSVDNALQVLLLLQERPVLRLAEVAEALGVARSTAHRLLAVLAHRGFVTRGPVTPTYRAGSVLIAIGLGAVGTLDMRELVRPHLEWLRDQLGETVHLVMLEGAAVRFVHAAEGRRALRVGNRTGMCLPAYASSGGKALLAHVSPAVVKSLYPKDLPGVTDSTLADREALLQELAMIRARGYATNFGESERGVTAVGVSLPGPAGRPVIGVVAAAPSTRLAPDDIPGIAEQVAQAAERISESLWS